MQNWSWSDPGRSPRPPPERTPRPPVPTPFTLRSSSRKNSCKHGSPQMSELPPAKAELPQRHLEDCHSTSYGVAFAWPYARLMMFLCFFGAVPFQRSSFRFYNSVVLFVGMSACQPDVYKNAFTVNCTNSGERVERSGRPDFCCRATRQSNAFTTLQAPTPTWMNA